MTEIHKTEEFEERTLHLGLLLRLLHKCETGLKDIGNRHFMQNIIIELTLSLNYF